MINIERIEEQDDKKKEFNLKKVNAITLHSNEPSSGLGKDNIKE